MMAVAGVELETLVSEPDALTTRPPPCASSGFFLCSEVFVAKFQNYEYTLREMFITCGT